MDMLNPHPKPRVSFLRPPFCLAGGQNDHAITLIYACSTNVHNCFELVPGKWRLLYYTGRHIGLMTRQPPIRVLIGNAYLPVTRPSESKGNPSLSSEISFKAVIGWEWPHDKNGVLGKLQINSLFKLKAQLYIKEDPSGPILSSRSIDRGALLQKFASGKYEKAIPYKELPSSLPVAKLISDEIEIRLDLREPLKMDMDSARNVIQGVRTQIPPEIFDLSKLVCRTYVDSRLLVLRSVNGSAPCCLSVNVLRKGPPDDNTSSALSKFPVYIV